MTLRSERLIYQEIQATDRPLLLGLFTDPAVMRYAYRDAYADESEFQSHFERILSGNEAAEDRKAYDFAVFRASDNRFIGMCDLHIERKCGCGGNAEIGYFLLSGFWGCGYASEMAGELVRFGMNDLGLHRIYARCHAENAASERVMQKCGMSREGVFSKARLKNGSWHDELRYAITIDR